MFQTTNQNIKKRQLFIAISSEHPRRSLTMGSSCTLGGNFQLGWFTTIRDEHVWDGDGSTVLKNLKDFSENWGTSGPEIGYVMSFHVISCHFMSSHVILCHFMSCRSMSFHVMSCHVISCHFISCHFMPFHVMSCHVISCHVISCHFISCHFMSFHMISSHVMSCHVISFHVISCHFI